MIDKVYTIEYTASVLRFDWNEEKNRRNFRKHGIWFEEAQKVWGDKNSIEFFDPKHSAVDERFIRIGHSTNNRLLLVIFCENTADKMLRIISARKTTLKEREQYEEGI